VPALLSSMISLTRHEGERRRGFRGTRGRPFRARDQALRLGVDPAVEGYDVRIANADGARFHAARCPRRACHHQDEADIALTASTRPERRTEVIAGPDGDCRTVI